MWLHVEPTSRCNASCPGCPRNNLGYGLTNFIVEDLDPQILNETLDKYKVKQIQMCGNLGDPCAAKNIDEQFDVIKNISRLQIHTNGGLRKPSWWADLAKRFAHVKQFDIWFAIDGIGDTHSYYRQGTNYDRVIENAQAFINAGGSAYWQFIPFAHNESQIEECIKLSQKMKFKKFEFVPHLKILSLFIQTHCLRYVETIEGHTIASPKDLARIVREKEILLGIVAVPMAAAQGVADDLVEAGVLGILNLAPIHLDVMDQVSVVSVDFTVAIEQLGFKVSRKIEESLNEDA